MATYKPYIKTASGKEEVKVPSSAVSGLATVATSGSYNDLADKPSTPDISGKANLEGGNTFTGKQTLTSPPADGYSINASGYVKGSWLQAPSTGKASSNTGKVCVLDDSGWVYYRTPAEIVGDGGGVTISQDLPTDIAKVGNLSNPNLLINPNFAINQRGKTLYTGAVFGVDRWKGIGGAVTATPVTNGIQLSSSATGNIYIKQIVETNLAGKTVTASCKLSAINSGEGGRFAVYWSTDGTSWTLLDGMTITTIGISKLTVTIPTNALYVSVDVGVRPSSVVVFEWAKLEIGSVATEFSPPSIAEELQKCYRYYKKITNLQQQGYAGFGIAYGDGSGARMIVENTFRVKPTITINGSFVVTSNGTSKTVSTIAMQSFNSTNIVVKFTLDSALQDGQCGYLQSNNSKWAYIAFDAEI